MDENTIFGWENSWDGKKDLVFDLNSKTFEWNSFVED